MLAEYLQHMGDDLTCVNAARVSFSVESTQLTGKDIGLIQFLARGCMSKDWDNVVEDLYADPTVTKEGITDALKWAKNMPTHWTPFSHAMITMRETVPIFVARQRFKHTVGFSYNEVSRRYVDDTPEFHVPEVWRARPVGGIKQGSGSDSYLDLKERFDVGRGGAIGIHQAYADFTDAAEELYTNMVNSGVAPEQARMVLPQSMLTTYWVTGSLYAWANAYIQRSDPHAQLEIQQLAKQWDEIIQPLFSNSWKALTQ
jgi:thymidylate synthase (FAD)